ncbi:hypothetical protein QUF74_08020 [Candidatus Halobeggiatoa sp. HSG11]|nr:hypothetical protein [Candidatus Halobeggiatoa sp. HSG11]
MDSPIVIAGLVFIGIYLAWFIIRLFADFILIGIACTSALFAYNVQSFYPEILMILAELNLLEIFSLPEEPNELAIFKIAGLIIACAVIISIPILPFSSTYRMMFGVEIPMLYCRKGKIKDFIAAEIQRQNQHSQPLSTVTEHEDKISENTDDLELTSDKSTEEIQTQPLPTEPLLKQEDKTSENITSLKPIENKDKSTD